MIEGFDKEIDALLRQTAQGETAFTADNPKSQISNPELHLDADEISAFADVNALPEKTRLRLTAHFADCDRCRKILSNVISLNSETASETVHAPQTAKIDTAAPWYRRLFAVPNLAYALGTLVLIFGGLIAFTFLKNAPQTTEVSQVREIPIDMKGASSDGETRIIESNAAISNSTAMTSNTATNAAAPIPQSNFSTTNTSGSLTLPNSNAAIANRQSVLKTETARSESSNETNSAALPKKVENEPLAGNTTNLAEQKNQLSSEDKTRLADDEKAVKSDAPAPPKTASRQNTASADNSSARAEQLPVNGRNARALKNVRPKAKQSVETETRAAGKTFKRQNNVWYDAGYNGQSTTNISRGTDEYKKLDTGLRSIADNFGGTVVVVWKGKAYRIQ